MDLITISAFRELLNFRDDLCISLYIPTIRAGREVRQNQIRFKNMLQKAEDRLMERGMTRKDVEEYLEPLKEITRNEDFWRDQEDGLAVFYAPESLFTYRLPLNFDQKLAIKDRFYIRPLLPMFHENENFYVLALDLSEVRLLAGSRYSVSELDLGDSFVSLEEFLEYEDPERRLSFHDTGSPSAKGAKGVFHQHLPDEEREKDIRRFFQNLDRGVMDVIGGEETPLILVGDEHILALYQEANSYPHVLDEIDLGNPNHLDEKDLHDRVWKSVAEAIEETKNELIDQYWSMKNQDQTSADIQEIVPAAYHGQIDSLLIVEEKHIWGSFDPEANQTVVHEEKRTDNRDLLEVASAYTLANGGSVYAMDEEELPEEAQRAAALMRY